MARLLDQTPLQITRTNHTSRLVFAVDRSGELKDARADRVQVTTNGGGAVVSIVPLSGISIPPSGFPSGLISRLAQLDALIDAEEARREQA